MFGIFISLKQHKGENPLSDLLQALKSVCTYLATGSLTLCIQDGLDYSSPPFHLTFSLHLPDWVVLGQHKGIRFSLIQLPSQQNI